MAGAGSESRDASYDEILRMHGSALRRVAAVYAPASAGREDLFQEICLAIWQALPRFEGRSSLRTFVFKIAHNRGLSHRWKRRVETGVDLDEAGEMPDPAPGPETLAERHQRRVRLEAAVVRLPLGHRQVVVLLLEGCTHAEIASILGLTENSVAVRASRARAELARMLAAEGAGA